MSMYVRMYVVIGGERLYYAINVEVNLPNKTKESWEERGRIKSSQVRLYGKNFLLDEPCLALPFFCLQYL